MSANYITKVNALPIAASEVVPNSELANKLQAITEGNFKVVPLDSSTHEPQVSGTPSTTTIYLTKEDGSSLKDPYTEWIYAAQDTNPGTYEWEIIGTTSMDLSDYKKTQTAVTVSGLGNLQTITAMSQNENGVISVTAGNIQSASTSQAGVVQLTDSTSSTSTTTAATPNSVKAAYDLANGKQDPITFDGTYNASSNKAATVSTVTTAIAALDGNITGTAGAGKTLTAFTETDGVVSATFGDISITKSQVSDFSHDHGNITNDGKISATGVAIASGDAIAIVDASENGKVAKTSITFDTASGSTNYFLSKNGTWETTPSANDGALKLQINGATAQSKFTANQSGDSTITFATGTNNGTIKVDGTEVAVAGLGSAAYTASTDYATAAQGTKADSAIQGIKCNTNAALTPDSNKIVTIPVAATSTYGVVTIETATI